MAKIQSERQQHDATKRALSDSQRKNQEMQQKVQFSESTIEQLRETNKRLVKYITSPKLQDMRNHL